jgi:cell wall-associated NlpC family hydrolase
MRPREQMRLLAVLILTATVLSQGAGLAHAAPATDKLVVLAGSADYLAYAEYPALDAHHADFAHGDLHVLSADGDNRDLGSAFGSPELSDPDPYRYSMVASMLTGYSAGDPRHVEWWDLADGTSGVGTLPTGALWQGSAPSGWVLVEADGTTLAVESVAGSLASYGAPIAGAIKAVSGPSGVVSIGANATAMAYQPWGSPTTIVTLSPPTVTDSGTVSCDSVSGAVLSCVDADTAGENAAVISVPLDGSAPDTYPGCGSGSVAVGLTSVFVCGGPPSHPRFASGPATVSVSTVSVRLVPGVSAFGAFVTVSPGRHSIISIIGAHSSATTLFKVPGPLATLDAASLRSAAADVEAEALSSGALAASPPDQSPAQLLQAAADALIRTARAGDPSLAPVDTRAIMGAVPEPLAHHSHRRPHHRHITATHTLLRFDHGLSFAGSTGIGTHRRHGGSLPARFQPADGVYVDPQLPKVSDPTISMVALRAALAKLGQPYVWAAAGPNTFDCSGLVQWAYAHAGLALTHFSGAQWNEGRLIPARDILPGDLVLFDHLVNDHETIHHVGMYLGAGWMVNAPYTGQYVDVVRVPSGVAGVVRP